MNFFRLTMATILLLLWLCTAWGQDMDFVPAVSLETFGQSLSGYELIFIQITISHTGDWQEELGHLDKALPIEKLQWDDKLRSDRLILSLDLRRKDNRGAKFFSALRYWKIHEEYKLEYEKDGRGGLSRIECISAHIEEKAPFGIVWIDLPEEDSKHKCLKIGSSGIQLVQEISQKKSVEEFQVIQDCDDCPKMVVIPAGSFVMGGSYEDEQPQHRVDVVKFAMGKYEVTFDEYDVFANSTGKDLPDDQGWGRGLQPVINVSWKDAQEYIEWLKLHTGWQYRFPSEAEWEYAARAGTTTDYWWGDEIREDDTDWAHCNGCGSHWVGDKTARIGSFSASPFGLYDTAGNVWEWVEDCVHYNYMDVPDDGSAWTEDCPSITRMMRGGSWNRNPNALRSANREWNDNYIEGNHIGFRVAQDLPD